MVDFQVGMGYDGGKSELLTKCQQLRMVIQLMEEKNE